MAAQQMVFDFLKETMGGRSTLLAVAGDLVPFSDESFDSARFLSQLLYWTDDREDWCPIAFKEWKDVAKLSRYAVEKARYYFYSLGILEYKVKKDQQGNPTSHYRLNFKALISKLKEFFKEAKTARPVIMTSFADLLRSRRAQDQDKMSRQSKPQYKENNNEKNIGRQENKQSKQEKVAYYSDFYL